MRRQFSRSDASLLQIQKYNCKPKFLMTFFSSFPQNFLFFPLFSTLKLLKLQLQLHTQSTVYNCKLHFTTAEIVISYMLLNYALVRNSNHMSQMSIYLKWWAVHYMKPAHYSALVPCSEYILTLTPTARFHLSQLKTLGCRQTTSHTNNTYK